MTFTCDDPSGQPVRASVASGYPGCVISIARQFDPTRVDVVAVRLAVQSLVAALGSDYANRGVRYVKDGAR